MQPGIIHATLACLCWGLFPIYFRWLRSVPALEIIMHRTVWSLVFVAALLLVQRQWAWLGLVLRQPRQLGLFALSALLLAANWLIYVWAVTHDHVVDASLGYFILPLVNVALGTLLLRERPRRGQWLAVLLAGLGVLWLTTQAGHLPWIALALAFSFGFYGLLRKMAVLGSLHGLALETALLTPLALLALAWWGWQGMAAWPQVPATVQLGLLAAGPVTALPLLLFASGARRISLTTLGLLQYIVPMLQFLCGVWLFGETFDTARLAGFGLIWLALAGFSAEGIWHQRRKLWLRPARQRAPKSGNA